MFAIRPHFQEGRFYIHNSVMDVCVEVVRVLETSSRYHRMEIRTWRVSGYGMPWLISEETRTMKVLASDLGDWQEFDMDLWCELERRSYSHTTH